ncbi:prolyl 4-hydroxylase subunit alpha-1-like [Dermacentor variabilis]|uniref:prolyl 4-hydroxylase subunit alpha-1-like n=1 Tax=Dermacentor variabilis TaxID=34621 RepID=UPI003F5B2F11
MSPAFRSLVSLAFTFHVASCASDLFTATEDMQKSVGTEHVALEDGHFYILSQERQLAAAVSRYETLRNAKSLRTGQGALGTFLFLSGLTNFNSYATLSAARRSLRSLPTAFLSPSFREWWPTDSDVAGAAIGICKLQHLYNIPATKMAAMKSRLLPAASPEDFACVARGCSIEAEYGNTSAWVRAALSETSSSPTRGSFRSLRLGLGWLQANDERWPRLQRWAKSIYTKAGRIYPSSPESDINEYKHVCVQQGFLRPPGSRLVCKMSTNFGDPRLILQPLKLEVLSLKPRVVVISDFLSPSEVHFIRSAAQKGFERAGIYSPTTVEGMPSWKRIGKVSWLWDSDHNFLQRLSRRIAVTTGVSLESAEAYQVANYGIGGHYTPHMDAHGFDKVADHVDIRDGNRLATMLMYLTDVAAGGATAFVRLGVAVKPRVGDALFWYDVEPYDGDEFPTELSFWHQKRKADELTTHVGCPVLSGSKWIVTKWMHERNNLVVHYNTPG